MLRTRVVYIIIMTLATSVAAAATPAIEAELDACIEKEGSTAGQMSCIDAATKKWDAELNRVYGALMKKLPEPARKDAKAAQLAWIKFRDAEDARIRAMFNTVQGTMYAPMEANAVKEVIRRRVEELQKDLEFLNEHGESAGK